jgi:hypothetical protein
MDKYASIETVFKRDKTTNKLLFGELRLPEFGCVKEWVYQEKVDGMNIRLILTEDGCEIKGRTDNAQIPNGLKYLPKLLYKEKDLIKEHFGIETITSPICFYGEGYGGGIQKGGKYRGDNGLAIFDIFNKEKWLDPYDVSDFCLSIFGSGEFSKMPIHSVPELGACSRIPITKEDLTYIIPKSFINGLQAEGIVARPKVTLFDKYGNRIMWKLCFREYK